jgi:hypothetical protein
MTIFYDENLLAWHAAAQFHAHLSMMAAICSNRYQQNEPAIPVSCVKYVVSNFNTSAASSLLPSTAHN